tara:strand:+ start:5941 stop:6741 length:801 start_codon:yes stop_codon:yes gene_type:complete
MAVIVVDTTAATATASTDRSIIGFDSILPISTVSGENADTLNPFSNCLDYRDNTKYSPAISAGTIVIEFTQSLFQSIDYFAFAIHNSQDAGLTGTYEVDDGTGYAVVAEFASLANNKPFVKYFGSISTVRQRLTLSFTSKLYIGTIYTGAAVVMDRTPSLGFQPAKYASLDTVEQSTTQGNNFIIGRREKRGNQAKATFRYVRFDDLDTWYNDFSEHVLDSKPIFFKWSETKDQSVYGLQNYKTLTKPTYVTSNHADISLELNGYI